MNAFTLSAAFTSTPERLRESPAARFDGPQHFFDLAELSTHLLQEAHAGVSGHRQMTIFRHDATTMMLVAFEAGGAMTTHQANGLVTIHVLQGALRIEAQSEDETEWHTHDLQVQQVLVLAPGVLHSVSSPAPSQMLLTVHLEKSVHESEHDVDAP
jgi:quercetin dioxygenase-like cupin family protein